MSKVELIPVHGIPLVVEGDDIALIISQRTEIKDGDIIVVCSTIISKAEGRVRELNSFKPSKKAIELSEKLGKPPEFIQAVLEESEEILIENPFLLVKSRSGNICVNAGVDGSNIESGKIILPPEDPDKSAERLRRRFEEVTSRRVGVIVTDTNGRCFRKGVVGVAIGVSGIPALKDWIGRKDLYGNLLEVTVEAVADEIAGMANLLMGEGDDAIPAVIVRGLELEGSGKAGHLYRDEEEDVIRKHILSAKGL
jgi:coenzyme F420-0:L-glutamate ligase/coenzyme F420-1:gamma-L-glutamate ligase